MSRVIRVSAMVVLAAALSSCSMFDYSGMVGNKYALVYGVTRYTMAQGPGLGPNLQYPDADASAMYALLNAGGYTVLGRWVDGNGSIIVNETSLGSIGSPNYDNAGTFTDTGAVNVIQAPTKSTIIQDIRNLSATVGPNDVLVVYFSGHGTQDTLSTPSREYFDPYQSVAYFTNASPSGYYDDPPKSVRDDELGAAFAAINTPRKVLILDTCNSGGFIGNQLEVDATAQLYTGGWPVVTPGTLAQAISDYASFRASPTGLSPYGAQVLSAAGRDESCYEWSVLPDGTPLAHGVMTFFLLQGLQGSQADLNHDGHVTVLEAFATAKAGIEKNWNPYFLSSKQAFEPHISGGPVDFVLF